MNWKIAPKSESSRNEHVYRILRSEGLSLATGIIIIWAFETYMIIFLWQEILPSMKYPPTHPTHLSSATAMERFRLACYALPESFK